MATSRNTATSEEEATGEGRGGGGNMKDDNKACQLQLQLFPSDPERHELASLPCLVQHVFARSLPDILLVNLGDVPDASHWCNGFESLRTLIDRPRDKGPSTIVSVLNGMECSRHHARYASVSVVVRFHAFHSSFAPVPSTVHILTTAPPLSPLLFPNHLVPIFSARSGARPVFNLCPYAVTPLARSQP